MFYEFRKSDGRLILVPIGSIQFIVPVTLNRVLISVLGTTIEIEENYDCLKEKLAYEQNITVINYNGTQVIGKRLGENNV